MTKIAMRPVWMVAAGTAIAVVVALVFVVARPRHFDEQVYQDHVSSLRQLRQLDAESEVDVLKLRTAMLTDYDLLTRTLSRTSAVVERLRTQLASEPHDEARLLHERFEALRDLLAWKGELIERFKSDHSILRNSLAFLPTAADEIHEAIDALGHRDPRRIDEALPMVDDLLLASLLFSQRATREEAAGIGAQVDALDRLSARTPAPVAEHLRIFGVHVRTVAREQVAVDGLLNLIAASPSGPAIDGIAALLSGERQRNTARTERDRTSLIALSIVLTALLSYAAIHLARSFAVIRQRNEQLLKYGQGLEALVAERVAELRDSEARMAWLARYDSLTGLPNRYLFQDRLREAMRRADDERRHLALLFVDIDHFKQINDSLGHAVGDSVLKAVAERLRETMREHDTVARLGGDEFTVICEDLPSGESAAHVAEKVREALSLPLMVDGRTFAVSASIGLAVHTFGCDDRDQLLRAADIAMYRAKDSGRNAFAVFVPEMAVLVNKRVRMESLLRDALAHGEFSLVYQPKVSLPTRRICGAEALLRWNSAELGPVPPSEFVPVAEAMGLIVPIGEWVLKAACTEAAAWRRDGLPALSIAVNLSPLELKDARLIDRIATALRDSGLPAGALELELTEGVVMDDIRRSIETLNAIRALGVRLAVDDFGTGYSSLAYLSRLPIQTLKIDRALVTPMQSDPNAATLVATIVKLAHSLDLQVVAEGVEVDPQLALLQSLGCDQIQGYLFSRPIAADAFRRLVSRGSIAPVVERERVVVERLVVETA